MSLDNANREPSPCRKGEGCHVPLSNSCAAAQHLGGVSEGDRTGRADRVSRENSSGASETQPAVPGGEPTEPARVTGVVGVPRSSVDLSESKTDGERRRGTWVNASGHSEDGRMAGRRGDAFRPDNNARQSPEAATRTLPQSQGCIPRATPIVRSATRSRRWTRSRPRS